MVGTFNLTVLLACKSTKLGNFEIPRRQKKQELDGAKS